MGWEDYGTLTPGKLADLVDTMHDGIYCVQGSQA
jgi:hypothetical protein